MPDLSQVTYTFGIDWADKLQSLSLPLLNWVGGDLSLQLYGTSPPAINLSFPSLKQVSRSIYLVGNIDA